jgi:hypothetical protein
MRLSKSKLKKIILEELKVVLNEQDKYRGHRSKSGDTYPAGDIPCISTNNKKGFIDPESPWPNKGWTCDDCVACEDMVEDDEWLYLCHEMYNAAIKEGTSPANFRHCTAPTK